MIAHVTPSLLKVSLQSLASWAAQVPKQKSRHIWSVLPLKLKGAQPGKGLTYTEGDDRDFMDAHMKVRDDSSVYPYFDPFTHIWLPAGYFHSNMATFRKNTFARSWSACTWVDDDLVLASDYAEIFAEKALTKGGVVTKVPALPCAVWFYKKPTIEWPKEHAFHLGLPDDPSIVIEQFREDFHFGDSQEWHAIFNPDPNQLAGYSELLVASNA